MPRLQETLPRGRAPRTAGARRPPAPAPAVEVRELWQRFGRTAALAGVSLEVRPGEVHALLGPNGAGKTTLLRSLMGLMVPAAGSVRVAGVDVARRPRDLNRCVGLVPSQERTFYERMSGLENLRFFGRMHGLAAREAVARALRGLEQVGLQEAGRARVGTYSQGMKKRLSLARALLVEPAVLLVDEATHDLDPEGARRVEALVRAVADRGAAVVWTTQRVDEIRGLADHATVLVGGGVRFRGTVAELVARADARRYVLQVGELAAGRDAAAALGGLGELAAGPGGDPGQRVLHLREEAVLGDAIAALAGAGVRVLACREERPPVEEAFMALTSGAGR